MDWFTETSRRARRGACLRACVAAAAWACTDPVGPDIGPPSPPDVRAFVEGAALANLDSHGHFVLPPPAHVWPFPMLSAQEAEELAWGVLRTWYTNPNVATLPNTVGLVEGAEGQHGRPIDWHDLDTATRPSYYAESHLEPLADTTDGPTLRHSGPHYLVPFYSADTPVVVVGVSAHATNVFIDGDGFVRDLEPLGNGNEFRVSGIPLTAADGGYPPIPETAVQFAFERTGVRVTEVPTLGVPGNRWERNAARWHLRLARRVAFERLVDGATVESDVVYVASAPISVDRRINPAWEPPPWGLRLLVPVAEQPTHEVRGEFTGTIRAGYAVDLHEVRVVP